MRPGSLRPLVLGRPATSEQMLVSFPRHPFSAREMGIEGTAGALDIVIRVYVQHDPRNLAPVGTFRIGIQHPHIRDGVLMVVRRVSRGSAGAMSATSGSSGTLCMGPPSVA